jgi:hypothetical protein
MHVGILHDECRQAPKNENITPIMHVEIHRVCHISIKTTLQQLHASTIYIFIHVQVY